VVDDDVSNRTVAESLITNLGHRQVAFAVNGREAVERLVAEQFDVVLMDNRMPIMDGFTATRLIRDPATGATDPAVYIIALTANASAEDRMKCLAGGMDDFVTKPVRAPAMGEALGRAVEHLLRRARPAQPAAPDPLPPGLSADELMASFDAEAAATAQALPGSPVSLAPEVLEKITAIFFRETPRRLESIRSALARRDATALGLEAHTLKSNSRYLNASHLSELCARLETMADHGQFGEIEPLLTEAEQAYAVLRDQLLQPLTT
jgi:CheY-like chemotaxis protein